MRERERLVEQTLADWRELVRRSEALEPGTDSSESLRCLARMGQLLKAEGRWAEARDCHEAFLRRTRECADSWAADIARALLELGEIAEEQSRESEAWAHYEEVVARFEAAPGTTPFDAVPSARYRMGWLLCFQEQFDRARACFTEMMLRYGQAPEDWLRGWAVQAHRALAHVFHSEGRREEAMARLVELSRRHGDSADPSIRSVVLRALFDLGWMCQSARDASGARRHYEQLLRESETLPPSALDEEMLADTHQGLALLDWNQGRWAEAEAHFEASIRRYATLPLPRCGEQHPRALTSLGWFLASQGRFEESHRCLGEVVALHGDTAQVALQAQVARALRTRGHVYAIQGLAEQSRAVYAELVRRFGASSEAVVLQEVAMGLHHAGRALMGEARQCWKRGAGHAASECLLQAREMLEASLARAPQEPIVLGHLAWLAFLQGRWEEAHVQLEEVVRRGGGGVCQDLLDEAREHATFLDEKWGELVLKLMPR
ncbi:MAG: tetratricopeptide repeat protein [Cystobacter sp.]